MVRDVTEGRLTRTPRRGPDDVLGLDGGGSVAEAALCGFSRSMAHFRRSALARLSRCLAMTSEERAGRRL